MGGPLKFSWKRFSPETLVKLMSNRLIESSAPMTVMQRLDEHARSRPEQWAFRFLSPPTFATEDISYRELRHRALRVARSLRSRHADGNRVLLILAAGSDYIVSFLGCLYAGAIAVPLYPPRPHRVPERFLAVGEDSRARFAIATSRTRASVEASVPDDRLRALGLEWIEPTGDDGADDSWALPYVDGQTPAFLQYTSGSTAAPKGVVVTHRNLEHNIRAMEQTGELSADETLTVNWLPPFHDMGLIAMLLTPIYVGFTGINMPSQGFGRQPLFWLKAISHFQATSTAAPNFALDLCAAKLAQEPHPEFDLSSLQVIYNGAEPIIAATLERFAKAFTPFGYRPEIMKPCYGLAESTLIVSCQPHDRADRVCDVDAAALERNTVIEVAASAPAARRLVSCGRPIDGLEIKIVDSLTRKPCGEGAVGEIWIRGPSVARGYWGNRKETLELFRRRLAGGGDGLFLHTGDLGFLLDGELFVTGRQKDLIVIAGRNHYPQDIELTARDAHPALAGMMGAAFSVPSERGEELALVHEVNMGHRHADGVEIMAELRGAVAEQHELALTHFALVHPASLPKTSSGKIRRRRCAALFTAGEMKSLWSSLGNGPKAPAPRPAAAPAVIVPDATLRQLRRLVAAVLEVAPEALDVNRPLTQQGMSSLRAAELQCQLEKTFEITLDAEDFFDPWTVQRMGEVIVTRSAESQEGR